MKNPVLFIVDIIDAGDGGPLLGDTVFCNQIGNEITCQPRVGKTIGVGIIQLTELAAAVTNSRGRTEILGTPDM